MLFARFVVKRRGALQSLAQVFVVYDATILTVLLRPRREGREFERIQGRPRVAARVRGEPAQLLLTDGNIQLAQAPRRVARGFGEDPDDLVIGQLIQDEDLDARKQSRVDLE